MISNLISLVSSFGKIGFIAMGGGNSMLKLIEYEAINNRHWVGQEEFINMMGSTFLFPGLTAVKLAALIGYKTAGLIGLLIAVVSINLPGLFLVIIGYQFLNQPNDPVIKKIMVAVQYGALALLAAATFSIGQGVVSMYFSLPMVAIALVFFIALVYFSLSPFWGFLIFIGICFFLIH
jgi:chromate transporter